MRDNLNSSSPGGEERSRLTWYGAVAWKVLRWVTTMIFPVLSGLVGLGSLCLPWALLINSGWFDRFRFERVWGLDLLLSRWDPRPALLLLVVGSLLCVVTPFLTRNPKRRYLRSLLYGFYAFLGILAILDVESWIATPRMYINGGVIMFSEIGVRTATYAVIGMAITAVAAFLEKRPGRPSVRSLVVGVASGVSVLYTFFKVDWIFRWWSDSLGYGLSGFDLAFYHFRELNWLGPSIQDPTWRLLGVYLTSLFFYMIPVLAVFVMLTPFMKLKWNLKIPLERALHIFIGAALFLMGCYVSLSASDFAIHQGLIFLMVTGIFLVVSQSVMQVYDQTSSRDQSAHPKIQSESARKATLSK